MNSSLITFEIRVCSDIHTKEEFDKEIQKIVEKIKKVLDNDTNKQ